MGVLSLGFAAAAAEPPSVNISNGVVKAKLWLTDSKDGYYRSTRFDWSGSVWSLESGGHSYFGQWNPRYDPLGPSSITGPVEDYTPLHYTEAKPGETFVKIGVGVLKKIDDQPYRINTVYEMLDIGKWTVRSGPDFVEYRHELADPKTGYGYIYTKTVRLTAGKPQMTIDHNLKNTGTTPIATNVYNHGFFMLDAQPTGPDFTVTFPWEAKAERDMAPAAAVKGKQIVYLLELQTNPNQGGAAAAPAVAAAGGGRGAGAPGAAPAVAAPGGAQANGGGRAAGAPAAAGPPTGASSVITGFSLTDPKDFDIRVENKKTGAGIRITGDHPLWRINFWSTRATVCPEAYVEVKADPGKETSWRLTYDFYSLPAAGR